MSPAKKKYLGAGESAATSANVRSSWATLALLGFLFGCRSPLSMRLHPTTTNDNGVPGGPASGRTIPPAAWGGGGAAAVALASPLAIAAPPASSTGTLASTSSLGAAEFPASPHAPARTNSTKGTRRR